MNRYIPLDIVDIRTVPEKQKNAEFQRFVTEETQNPFILNKGPLIRAALICLRNLNESSILHRYE